MRSSLPLVAYFLLNLAVTSQNKTVVSRTSCPVTLTALHATATWVSCASFDRVRARKKMGKIETSRNLSWRQHILLFAFSILYTVNIAVSNASLAGVSLALHQTIRATAPALTILLSTILFREPWTKYSLSTYLSLVPITVGVAVASYDGRYSASLFGFLLTFIGAVLAVLKTILTSKLLLSNGLKLDVLELLLRLSPYAAIQAACLAWFRGEGSRIWDLTETIQKERRLLITIVLNVVFAAVLNLASFQASRASGPVSMAVAANLKQVVILVVASLQRDGRTGAGLWYGTLFTAVGGVWYAVSKSQQDHIHLSQDSRYGDMDKRILPLTGADGNLSSPSKTL